MSEPRDPLVHPFNVDISKITVPERFTFPFYYTPHPLAKIAAQELQDYLELQFHERHNFGLGAHEDLMVIGKMFGVLVVRDTEGQLGHLWAFSGKLAEKNDWPYFVPPIYDTLNPDAHYKQMERILNQYNEEIDRLEHAQEWKTLQQKLHDTILERDNSLSALKVLITKNKAERQQIRQLTPNADIEEQLSFQSKQEQIKLKHLKKEWQEKIEALEKEVEAGREKIIALKDKRKNLSHQTQQFIFQQYNFLNANGIHRNVLDIFAEKDMLPPSGAGECAMPKLLQYAYTHQLQPIAMAEFWWGQSPPSEVRQHKHFYPSCRSKCEPILGHMLQGITVEHNPMLDVQDLSHAIEKIYEDDYLIAINKPPEMLSVPGKNPMAISVWDVMKEQYPYATGPLLVHRLDMSTSGIILVAKNKEVHENLQAQFIKRTVKKRYVALLQGKLLHKQGRIELPIRVDLDNRPRQLVCYEYGKKAITEYEVIQELDDYTKVYFYPITGRTHQLRVHAAHHQGLNAPIVGDDLYGEVANRLHLHAQHLTFKHPITKEIISLECPETF